MDRVRELYNIAPIQNVKSIFNEGILSYNLINARPHIDISLSEVQERRENVKITNTDLPLHHYANLYFCARNPMMYKRSDQINDICVLGINKEVLLAEGVVISDRNASSNYCRYYEAREGLAQLDFDMIFARDWRHPDNPPRYYEHKSKKCAEVLVPELVHPSYIRCVYYGSINAKDKLNELDLNIALIEDQDLFFR